jgi:citrate lyase subunit beta/citryl-CoA lyase
MSSVTSRPHRSALYMPANNVRAIDKARTLPADVVIFDLEDAVAPDAKESARANLLEAFRQGGFGARKLVIRVNHTTTPYFDRDVEVAVACAPDAILVPKVSNAQDIATSCAAISRHVPAGTRAPALWAMIETAEALTGLTAIAQAGQTASVPLECLVVGTNDIAKETGVSTGAGRMYLLPWLMDIVLAAKRHGLVVLDGVWNDFKDMSGFDDEVRQGKGMGFDGKTLIHPTQIDLTNSVFAPTAREIADAHAVVAAFARPENAGAGVINLEGRMVELLHLEMARRTLSLETAIRAAQSA